MWYVQTGHGNSGMGRWAAAQRELGAVQYYVDAKQGREEREGGQAGMTSPSIG